MLGDTSETILCRFDGSANEPRWRAINDEVMGGESEGEPLVHDGRLIFRGETSLANNGGFSSIRASVRHYDLSAFNAISLAVKGDGRRYQFRLYTSARYGSSRIAYRGQFDTRAGQWQTITLPFTDLQPVFRGRRLSGPPFDPSDVVELGFLIADRREGPFELVIDRIEATTG
ncbi:MAG: CIA30 family protein [Marinobacter sp.]|uniref:CIA30 family protein n=1 Tax=Marinobacter sp. TaxID=50741 RepID=UPI00299E5CB5|nr:CIA30 family protein [Marinobacter sp.]MDX1633904.1 CIA30 family protein [Marinobacter sp.]